MLNLVTFLKALISTIGAFFEWKHDEALRQDGANKAELEGRKEADEIAANTKRDRSDDGVRERIGGKYFRD